MIVVQISSTGIREVVLQARDNVTEDLQLALWPLIREELDRLDQRLKREGPAILADHQRNQRKPKRTETNGIHGLPTHG